MIDRQLLRLNPPEVRLLDEEGRQIGVVSFAQAQQKAAEEGVDVILLDTRVQPPVVRLGDLKKFLYIQEKKHKDRKKKVREPKEVRVSFREAEGDLRRKAQRAKEFLTDGHPVQIKLMLKGREKAHPEFAEAKFAKLLSMIDIPFKFVSPIKKTPNFFVAMIVKG